MSDRLLTTAEAARNLGVSDRTLARWTRDGRLRPTSTTLGGHYRWDAEDLRGQIQQIQQAARAAEDADDETAPAPE